MQLAAISGAAAMSVAQILGMSQQDQQTIGPLNSSLVSWMDVLAPRLGLLLRYVKIDHQLIYVQLNISSTMLLSW